VSEKCHNCRERPSKGSLGMMRYCYECAADLTGHAKRYVRSEACTVQLVDGTRHVGYASWVPDFIAARRQKGPT
jgi:hypothetical protein